MAKQRVKKPRRLSSYFVRYALCVFLMVPVAYGLGMGLYGVVQATGMVEPAIYNWQELSRIEEDLRRPDALSDRTMPTNSVYAAFSEDGTFLNGSADIAQRAFLWNRYLERGAYVAPDCIIVNRDGEIRAVELTGNNPAFRNEWLRAHFPNPEMSFILLSVLFFLCGIALLSAFFGKSLGGRVKALMLVTQKIQAQDLEFPLERSDVYEIDMVLRSMDEMKMALHDALTAQWAMERTRYEEIQGLTHDIGTPLTIIQGNADLLEASETQEKSREYGRYIAKNARVIGDYVAALNHLSHAGLPTPEFTTCSASMLWGELTSTLRAMCTAKQIRVAVEGAGSRHNIRCNPQSLARAFGNVFSNAEYHTPPGGSIVFRIEDQADAVRFTVTNSGQGFSSEALARATEPFFTEKAVADGHGMGLSIAHTIVHQHGGSLAIANDDEGRASVTIHVPACRLADLRRGDGLEGEDASSLSLFCDS